MTEPHIAEPHAPVGTVAELFAGVGGFRLGLARAGFETIYSNQWEPSTKKQHASDVYVAQFGPEGHSNVDIAAVDAIPTDFDLLVGGFPCQDYSVAKSLSASTGLEGKKGVLWWEILRLVRQHRPKFIFLENVDRLLKSPSTQRGRDFAVMLSCLGREGYTVEWRVANAAEYGFPQRRIRVFIVAIRSSLSPDLIGPSGYLLDSGVLARALPVASDGATPKEIPIDEDPTVVSRLFGAGLPKSPFENAGVFVEGVAHTLKTTAVFHGRRATLGDVLVEDGEVPDDYWIPKEKVAEWVFLKGAKSVERTHKASGFSYRYSEGKMAFPDALDRPSRTILTGEGGSTPSRFKHAVQTEGGLRRLLPVELERLSGFPDGWTQPDKLTYKISDGRRAFFIGNALVVGLIERVGQELANRITSVNPS